MRTFIFSIVIASVAIAIAACLYRNWVAVSDLALYLLNLGPAATAVGLAGLAILGVMRLRSRRAERDQSSVDPWWAYATWAAVGSVVTGIIVSGILLLKNANENLAKLQREHVRQLAVEGLRHKMTEAQLAGRLEDADAQIRELQRTVGQQQGKIETQGRGIADSDKQSRELQQTIVQQQKTIGDQERIIADTIDQLGKAEKRGDALEGQTKELQQTVQQQSKTIAKMLAADEERANREQMAADELKRQQGFPPTKDCKPGAALRTPMSDKEAEECREKNIGSGDPIPPLPKSKPVRKRQTLPAPPRLNEFDLSPRRSLP